MSTDAWAEAFAHRLRMPLLAAAPEHALPIAQYLERVAQEEATAGHLEPRGAVTRIRKVFYNSDGWDDYLLPQVAQVPAPYATRIERRHERVVDIPLSPLDLRATDAYVLVDDGTGQTPPIAADQNLCDPDGHHLDIAHIFAGLDAALHPSPVDGPLHFDLASNLDAVTWLGDLGSVLARIQLDSNGGRGISVEGVQAVIDRYAPPADMLGNIDPYAIFAYWESPTSLASHLSAYYAPNVGPDHPRRRRVALFARHVGLGALTGDHFEHEADWIAAQVPQVRRAAAMYTGVNTAGVGRFLFAPGLLFNRLAEHLLGLFVEELKVTAREDGGILAM